MTENEEVMILENLRPGCGEKLSFSEGEICETIDTAISALKEIQQYREIGTVEECREAVEKRKTFCDSAEKYADGKCIGYGKSEIDDEPCEICKGCNFYVGYGELESEEE